MTSGGLDNEAKHIQFFMPERRFIRMGKSSKLSGEMR